MRFPVVDRLPAAGIPVPARLATANASASAKATTSKASAVQGETSMNHASSRMSRMGICTSTLILSALAASCGGGTDLSTNLDTSVASLAPTMTSLTSHKGGNDRSRGAQGSGASTTTADPVVTADSSTPITSSSSIVISSFPAGSAGFDTERIRSTTTIAQLNSPDVGSFRMLCQYSHMAYDDPIVFPGQPGASHLHVFFGNTLTDAFTTIESLRTTGNSTCTGGTANRSAYWVPAMIDTATGKPVTPWRNNAYYKQGYVLDRTIPIEPMPEGLRMIAGDSRNDRDTSDSNEKPGQSPWLYRCNDARIGTGRSIPACAPGGKLKMEVAFPQCWDGVNLDSPDHKSHMSYPEQYQRPDGSWSWHCPAAHPVALAALLFHVEYVVPAGADTTKWRLSSDLYDPSKPGGYSAHGDWMNGWKKDVSDAWSKNCVAGNRECGQQLLGDGRELY